MLSALSKVVCNCSSLLCSHVRILNNPNQSILYPECMYIWHRRNFSNVLLEWDTTNKTKCCSDADQSKDR